MNVTIRPATQSEMLYAAEQSEQISSQTGCIGILAAEMDFDEAGFFSTWTNVRANLNTDTFKREFDDVINRFRFGNGDEQGIRKPDEDTFLTNRSTLSMYCWERQSAKTEKGGEAFCFRADTDSYTYIMRCIPVKAEFNLYCYCYRRDWLERHMERAKGGIRFIDSRYRLLFKIGDGDSIRITDDDGYSEERVCRYIDDYHTEIGINLYHICEFAERMEKCGRKYEPAEAEHDE